MNITPDGHLSLHVVDLSPENREVHPPKMEDFSFEARIAAAYANRAGYPVTFVRPGFMIEPVAPNGYFLPIRKVKPYPKAKPVPKSAIGKCVDHFPAKRIFREVERFVWDDEFAAGDGPKMRWCVAPGGTSIQEGDMWR